MDLKFEDTMSSDNIATTIYTSIEVFLVGAVIWCYDSVYAILMSVLSFMPQSFEHIMADLKLALGLVVTIFLLIYYFFKIRNESDIRNDRKKNQNK